MFVKGVNRLCTLIIQEQFGPIVEKVAFTLLIKGRVPLNYLIKNCSVSPEQIRHSLFILIQHSLVSYADITEGDRILTYYKLEVQNVLDRANLLSIISLAKKKYGNAGLLIAKALILNGKLKPKDIEFYVEHELKNYTYEEEKKTSAENGTYPVSKKIKRENGLGQESNPVMPLTIEHIRKALLKMIQTRYLVAVTNKDMLTKLDQSLLEDAKLRQSLGIQTTDRSFKKAIAEREARKAIEPKIINIRGLNRDLASGNSHNGNQKRLNGSEVVETVNEEFYFQINFGHAKVMIRNKQIIEYASTKLNPGAGETLRAFVSTIEAKIPEFNRDATPVASGMDIQGQADDSVPLETFIEIPGLASNSKPNKLLLLNEFMKLLSQDEAGFLTRADDRTIGQYHMDYCQIRISMGLRTLEKIIKKKFGSASWRIFRVLFFNGLMDEHQLAKIAILEPADVKNRVFELAQHRLIETQEIPRSFDRAANRALYLFTVNIDHAIHVIKDFSYWALGGLIKRRKWEVSSRAAVLKKLEREDVKADQNIMSPSDLKVLEGLNRILSYLDVSQQRITDMIVTLE